MRDHMSAWDEVNRDMLFELFGGALRVVLGSGRAGAEAAARPPWVGGRAVMWRGGGV